MSDVNDNVLVFIEMVYYKNLFVNILLSILVVRVKADDRDSGINREVRYFLSNSGIDLVIYNMFRIDVVIGDFYIK